MLKIIKVLIKENNQFNYEKVIFNINKEIMLEITINSIRSQGCIIFEFDTLKSILRSLTFKKFFNDYLYNFLNL